MSEQAPRRANPLRAGFLIHDVSRMRRTIFDQRLKPLGITRSQWWVLAHLSRKRGEGFAQVELARMLDVGKVTLGGLIDRLEANGLVARVPDPVVRRSKRVVLSPKGEGLVRKLETLGSSVHAEIMVDVTVEEELAMIKVLEKMKAKLRDLDAVPAATAGRRIAGEA